MDLNVQDWKGFKLSYLLESDTGDTDITQDSLTETGTPVVSSGEGNTGVIGVTSAKAKIFPANTITMDMFGFAFPRSYEYKMVTHARVFSLSIKKHIMTTPECIFMATLLNSSGYKYAYGRMCSWERIKDDVIQLPIQHNPDGTPVIDADKTYSDEGYVPDWQFMEDYIKSLHSEPITTTRGAAGSPSLGVDRWEEFTINELFDLVPTKGKDSTELTEGADIPYIAAKHDENGLMMFCRKQGYEDWISHGNCIVFVNLGAGSAGYTNYMQEDFIGMSGKTTCGYIKDVMTPNIGMFLSTVLSAERPKYSFGRSWTGDRLTGTTIKLPIQRDAFGNPVIDPEKKYSDKGYIPDWDFMERYIDSLPYSDKIA